MENEIFEQELDIVDEVGGCHGGGVGWNPQGIFVVNVAGQLVRDV